MARTPLSQRIQEARALAALSERRRIPVAQALEERALRRLNRRRFLANMARGVAGVAALTALAACRTITSSNSAPRVVIVGGGLAGLTCAWRLGQAGVRATIYEAAGHLGGRCRTRRGSFLEDQTSERGGEFIDTGHKAVRRLARSLGLVLDDLLKATPADARAAYHVHSSDYPLIDAATDFRAVHPLLQRDAQAAGYPTRFDQSTPAGGELDRMSVTDWIRRNVPGGTDSRLGRLLHVAYTVEFGSDAEDQSALNLVYFLSGSPANELKLYGESDERFRVRGGNDLLVSGLASRLPDQVQLRTRLAAIRKTPDGRFALELEADGTARTETADHVVLALPFSVLRATVDYRQAGFGEIKREAIARLGASATAKLQLQFHSRHWRARGLSGETFSDTGHQCTWEASRAQPGRAGLLVNYLGGSTAAGGGGSIEARAARFLQQAEPVLPGLTAQWNGRAGYDYWPGYQWAQGSYCYWRVGQYTKFAGIEGVREGRCHFAGDHTSYDSQGYMNGAVESGERAAREILGDLS
jgi:monoamine oxidase